MRQDHSMTAEPKTDFAAQRALVARLAAALPATRAGAPATTIETHASWVLIAGGYAYKIKKALDLGFLDFTTLERRKRCCELELALNRRLAPDIYVDVVAIGGSAGAPSLDGERPPLEYAVRMREFPQDALGSHALARGELAPRHIDALAVDIAAFHGRIAVASARERFGAPDAILRYALDNFTCLAELALDDAERTALARLEAWTRREHEQHAALFGERREQGYVRECHGDLHLGNMVLAGGRLVVFDCIEFNDELRWIDVASEVAFVVMDLADRGAPALGHRFLNAYLEATGDYGGVALLPFYLAYRAMVRAKVVRLRVGQMPAGEARAALLAEFRGYLALARRFARPPRPALVVTHGLAGCGKTTATQALVEAFGGVRVRTDIERKRLAGIEGGARSGSAVGEQLYATDAIRRTYERVAALAELLLRGDELAVVDAACLMRWQRDLFRGLAAKLGVPFIIVAFTAPEATLATRIAQRLRQGTDASEADLAVLTHQLATQEPLAPDEMAHVVTRDTERVTAHDIGFWERVLARIGIDAARPERQRFGAK